MHKKNPGLAPPVIIDDIHRCYKSLIWHCLSFILDSYKTFSGIRQLLRISAYILTKESEKKEYFDYVYSIESKFRKSKKYLNISNYKLQ